MDKTNKIILWTAVIVMAGGFAANFMCNVGVKCRNCPRFSLSKEESINEGRFVTLYQPVEKSIKLKYHNDTVHFSDLWIEHGWFINSDICFFKTIETTDQYNATVEFKKTGSSDGHTFNLDGHGTGWGMGKTSKTVTLHFLPDSLVFFITEKNPAPGIGWKQEMKGDTVVFLKAASGK